MSLRKILLLICTLLLLACNKNTPEETTETEEKKAEEQLEQQLKAEAKAKEAAGKATLVSTTEYLPVCERTEAVKKEILKKSDKTDCTAVTKEDLQAIVSFSLYRKKTSILKAGDFSGFSSLKKLYLSSNHLKTLPANIFSGLSTLEYLGLGNNQLTSLPANIFSGLSSLKELSLTLNPFSSLPTNIFSDLVSLEKLYLHRVPLSEENKTQLEEALPNVHIRF